MRSLFILSFLGFALFSCNQKKQSSNSNQPDKKNENTGYTISKDGIGELKIGMTQTEVEKLLGQQFNFHAMKDSAGWWQDTVKAKYKEIDVSLYFERQYIDDDSTMMQLAGVETSNPLCKTGSGIGIGDEKPTIISAYDDNPIDMGPEFEPVNDSTWLPSKTKYNINVKDDKYDRELIFHLLNKKVVSLQAAMIMGD
ncbi:MAG TPA: hypothetical protein VIV35_06255 [Chitinophagaceae bacterium]